MRKLTPSIAVFAPLLLPALLLSCASGGRAPAPGRPESGSEPPPEEIYQGIREMTLGGSRDKFSIPRSGHPVWGVMMETGMPDATMTVIAIADGNASIYFSSGGGIRGGKHHASIRAAAVRLVNLAAEYAPAAKATTVYPRPEPGQVTFYLLTDQGVLAASASEKDLEKKRLPLAKLFDAGQDVITQYRLVSEARKAGR
jgi:hypothetical protein